MIGYINYYFYIFQWNTVVYLNYLVLVVLVVLVLLVLGQFIKILQDVLVKIFINNISYN